MYVGNRYMLLYLEDIIKSEISHINYVHQLSVGNRLILDTSSLRHLEITHNLRDGGQKVHYSMYLIEH